MVTMSQIERSLTKRLLALPPSHHQVVLARLLFRLTISARDLFEDGSDSQWRVARGLNEIFHQTAGQLLARIEGDQSRYPREVFWQILMEIAASIEVSEEILASIEWSIELDSPGQARSHQETEG